MIDRGTAAAWVRGHRLTLVPMLLSATAALALGFWRLGRPALFGSEADTFFAVHLDLAHLFRLLHHVDAVHGCYYLLLHFWMSGSTSLAWMRVPSVLGAATAAALVALLGRRLVGPVAGVLAGLVFAFSPFVMEYAQDGRSYAIVAALVATTMLALESAVRDPRPAAWVRYGAASTVAGVLHEFTLLAGIAFALSLAIARVDRSVWRSFAVATVVAWALVAPLVVFSTTQADAIGYLPSPTWGSVQKLLLADFGPDVPVAVVLATLAVIALVTLGRSRRRLDAAGLALPLVVVPPTLLLLASLGDTSYFDRRYVAYGMCGVALLVATGADTVARFALGLLRREDTDTSNWFATESGNLMIACATGVVAAVVLLIVQWSAQDHLRTVASRLQDFTNPSIFLRRHAQAGDAVLFSQARSRAGFAAYPGDYARLADISLAETPAQSGTFYGLTRPARDVRAALNRYDRVWLVTECGFSHSTADTGGPFGLLRHDYHRAVAKGFTGVCVTLWVKGPRG